MGETVTASPVLGGVITDLIDGATIAWALTGAFAYRVSIAASRVLANPSNLIPGSMVTLEVVHDADSTDLTYGDAYRFAAGAPPTLSSFATAVDFLTFFTDGTYMYLLSTALDIALPLVAPSGLTATNNLYGQVNLAWTNNSPNATTVVVERDNGIGYDVIATLSPSAVSYVDEVEPGDWTYRVKAKRGAVSSSPSPTTVGTSLLGAPTLFTASPFAPNTARCSWVSAGTFGTINFQIQKQVGMDWIDVGSPINPDLSLADANLGAPGDYVLRVIAIAHGDITAPSNTDPVTVV